ncbi:unnamed protein product [Choristocarpus tenellus]
MERDYIPLRIGNMATMWKGPSDSLSLDDLTRGYRVGHVSSGAPLIDACWKSDIEGVKALLDEGYNVNSKDSCQDTPLHAASSRKGVAVVQLLLDRGAVVNSRNKLKVRDLALDDNVALFSPRSRQI